MTVIGKILAHLATRSGGMQDSLIAQALEELCCDLHASDCESCPIHPLLDSDRCHVHKNGRAMLDKLRRG